MPFGRKAKSLSFLTEVKDFFKFKKVKMRKLLNYLWLALVSLGILALVYGGLTIFDVKNQNQNLNQKQKQLEKQIILLENKFEQLATSPRQNQPIAPNKIAGVATESIQAATPNDSPPTEADDQNQPIPQPSPSMIISPRPTQSSTSLPTQKPTPTPEATPTPTPTPVAKAAVSIEQVGKYQVDLTDDDTAFTILLRAGEENSFTVEYQMYDFGAFITCIAEICTTGNQYWAFYYNSAYSMVGASAQIVKDGDTTAWKLESF